MIRLYITLRHSARLQTGILLHNLCCAFMLIVFFRVFCFFPPPGILRTAVPDMDRESRDEYQVVLQAKDMGGHLGGLSGTTTVTVRLSDVNDNPPHFRRSEWRRYRIAAQPLPCLRVRRYRLG